MNRMKICAWLLSTFALCSYAYAQQSVPMPAGQFWLDTTASPVAVWRPTSPAHPFPVTGSFSASIAGFAPAGSYASLTVAGSSVDTALPASQTVVVAYNTGTTSVSCNLTVGAGSSTANKDQIAGGSWIAYTVGSNTHISCIDQTGSTSNVIIISGGSGLPTGAGGGGGSGGVVTQPTASLLNMTEANSAAILSATQSAIPDCGANPCTNKIGITFSAPNVGLTGCSSTITTGGTAQNAFAAQSTLHGFSIMNIDTTEPLWINPTATAVIGGAGSFPLQAASASPTFASAGSFTTPPGLGTNGALSVIAATTGHKWSCFQW